MRTVAESSLSPQDEDARFGVPSRRGLLLVAGQIAICMAFMETVLVTLFRVDSLLLLAAGGVALLAAYVAFAGLRAEIAIRPRLIARRTWWQHVFGRDGQMILFYPGDRIAKMPDGKWLLDGIPLSLPNRGRDGRKLVEVLAGAGLTVEDRQSEWRQAHPLRRIVLHRGLPAGIAVWYGVFATSAYSAGGLHDVMNAAWLVGAWVLALAWFAARAPRTKRQATVTHLPRLAVRPEHLAA
jgi:hypothetical protein